MKCSSYSPENGVCDTLLLIISKNLSNESKTMALGIALGFAWSDVDRFLKTNRMDGELTWKGTHNMLQNWKQNTGKELQREVLRSALIRSELAEVADQHFPEGLYTYYHVHSIIINQYYYIINSLLVIFAVLHNCHESQRQ